jgi:formamidopyrimidine-DNA glycosylase
MPESPEVETMRRGIAFTAGAVISNVIRPRSALRPITLEPPLGKFRRRAAGCRIISVGRLGKRVLLQLDSGDCIVIEPRMTGLVMAADPPNRKHLRLIFELSGGGSGPAAEQILFWDQRGLGVVRLVSPPEFHAIYGPAKIGPDALEISAAELRQRAGLSRRAIKVALLDQKVLAGVGNLYASEILHRAGIHPARSCKRLRGEHWQRIHAEMLTVLNDAILHQGSTLRDGTYRIARDEPGNYQFNHRVYQRHGEICLGCGKARIVRIVQAQRSTFFCPACQRK